MGKEKGQITGEEVLINLGEMKERKKTACKDCVGLTWEQLYIQPGSIPYAKEARCKKSENEKIKEAGFNPISGKDWEREYYPGGDGISDTGKKHKLCEEVNKGDCPKFEEATEEREKSS